MSSLLPTEPSSPKDVDDERAEAERAVEAALRAEIAAVRAEREAVDAEIAKLKAEGYHAPRDWPITPNDMVSEQLQELFSGPKMKDGDSIVFAPGTYHLDSTVILYGHDAESQILRNITLRGTPGDVLICADETSRLDHLFFVCRDPECYQGPEHRVIHFSGLNFRNGHLMRGRNAIVCALGDVDVVVEDCRVLKSRDAREGKSRSQNMLGKFKQPLFPGVSYAWLEGGWEACVADY